MIVLRWGVDLPYWDQWTLVGLFEKQAAGDLSLGEIAKAHNEHRLLFPRLLMLGLAAVSGWNVRLELMANVLLAFLLFLGLWRMASIGASRSVGAPLDRLLFLSISSVLIFSPWQWENWGWGWQIQIFLSIAAVVWALALLTGGRGRGAVLAAALAGGLGFVATFSFANALLLWPLGLVVLLAGAENRRAVPVWLGAAAVSIGAFFFRYQPNTERSGLGEPLDVLGYFLAYLGAPLSGSLGSLPLAIAAGGLGCVVWLVLAVDAGRLALRPSEEALAPARPTLERRAARSRVVWAWLACSAYAIASAALTAAGRSSHGLEQALTPRYVTIANLLWIGIGGALLLGVAARKSWSLRSLGTRAAVAATLLLTAGVGYGIVEGSTVLRRQASFKGEIRQLLTQGRSEEVLYRFLYPLRRPLESWLGWLCENRRGIYRDLSPEDECSTRFLEVDPDALATMSSSPASAWVAQSRHGRVVSLERRGEEGNDTVPVVERAFVGDVQGEGSQLWGWAALEEERLAYDELVVCLPERCVYRGGAIRWRRQDVADYLGSSSVLLAGFRLRLDAEVARQMESLQVFALRDGIAEELLTPWQAETEVPDLSFSWRADAPSGDVQIVDQEGRVYRIQEGVVEGRARLRPRPGGLLVRGWASQTRSGKPVDSIAVLVDGQGSHPPHRREYRGEASDRRGRPLKAAGFSVDHRTVDTSLVRVFGLTDAGEAGELRTRTVD